MSATQELSSRIARMREDAVALAQVELADVDAAAAADLHRQLRCTTDRIQAFAAVLLAHVETQGRWVGAGARTFGEWAAQRSRSSVGAARQEAALGRALIEDLPGTARALADGEVTLEHAQVLARFAPTSEARRAALHSDKPDRNEAHLLAKARQLGVDEFRKAAKCWAMRVDEHSAEREYRAACAKEYLNLSPRRDGMTLQGFLTVEHGHVLTTALRAVIGVPAADDKRAPDQRRAHALADLARRALDTGTAGGAAQVRPHINVHVSWETFQHLAAHAGSADADPTGSTSDPVDPATLDGGEPIPGSVLARIACDSEITRIVFGPTAQVLDVGRAQRTFSGQLRRAIIARDRTCQHPDCHAPPTLAEVHHIKPWSRGGPTSPHNGILLCWHHHRLVHQQDLTITRTPTGEWVFRRPDGTRVRPFTSPPGSGVPPGTDASGWRETRESAQWDSPGPPPSWATEREPVQDALSLAG